MSNDCKLSKCQSIDSLWKHIEHRTCLMSLETCWTHVSPEPFILSAPRSTCVLLGARGRAVIWTRPWNCPEQEVVVFASFADLHALLCSHTLEVS